MGARCMRLRLVPLARRTWTECRNSECGTASLSQASRRYAASSSGGSSSTCNGSSASDHELFSSSVLQQTCKIAGKQWVFETGRLATLAHASCLVSVGGTSVLGTAVMDTTPQLGADGVPLQVEYRERLAAAGRLPLRPDRRERVGSDREVLVARLVDRAVRPLIHPGFMYDTQVWCQLLSADGSIDAEVVAINAASAALLLAKEIPFTHPVGAVRVGLRNTRLVLNPSPFWQSNSQLSLTYAGSSHKATAIEATAAQVSNEVFKRAMHLAAHWTRPLMRAQVALARTAAAHGTGTVSVFMRGSSAQDQQHPTSRHQPGLPLLWPSERLQQAVQGLMEQPLIAVFSQHNAKKPQPQPQQQQQEGADCMQSADAARPSAAFSSSGPAASAAAGGLDKASRAAALSLLQHQLLADLRGLGLLADDQTHVTASSATGAAAGLISKEEALRAFDMLQGRVMRKLLLQGCMRVDGRQLDELRPISCQAGNLPRVVHGSGLFSRGETQSLATATVGHDRDVGQVDALFPRFTSSASNRLHLHYSFPPFSVGELGKSSAPNRREVGHGNLARSALLGLMPKEDDFPFVVRVTADTLSSSGSSSMAAVCAGALALRAAGVPMQGLAAGISIGLVTESPPQLLGPGSSTDNSGSSSGKAGGHGIYSRYVMQHMGNQHSEQDAGDADSNSNGDGDSTSSSSSDEDTSSSDNISGNEDGNTSASSSSSSGGTDWVLQSSYGSAVLLTDIQGIEDHHGDLDFKIAGTLRGITAVQLDTKLPGVDLHLLEAALPAAAAARQQLLTAMSSAAASYESSLEPSNAPQSGSVEVLKELVPRLIGPQGTTLMEIENTCGASLIVDDTGAVTIYAPTEMQYRHAVAAVQEVEGKGVRAGEVYRVKVLRVVDFGAYVALPNGLPALLHVSELSHNKIREVKDVVQEGEEFDVLCKGRDAKGFVGLSRKALLPTPNVAEGGDGSAAASAEAAVGDSGSSNSVSGSSSGSNSGSRSDDSAVPEHRKERERRQRPEDSIPRASVWRPPLE